MILALETSCDDTCAAVVTARGEVRASVVSSQAIHDRYGGVVPEVASRHHLELVSGVVEATLRQASASWADVTLVAVTQGPGLVGALLVGLATAKGLAAGRELPLVPVDHLQGHVAANFLEPDPFEPPFLCLIASGGHTLLARVEEHHGFHTLGRTLDDAAGEAFDKGARLLGLPFPGGPALERAAAEGDPEAYPFPGPAGRGKRASAFARSLDFSFAGIKTALLYQLRELGRPRFGPLGEGGGGEATDGTGGATRQLRADLAASYQRTIVDALVDRVQRALDATGLQRLAVGGGVAANGALRARLAELGVELEVPPPSLCTDNAAMIASAARFGEALPYPDYLGLDVYATGERVL